MTIRALYLLAAVTNKYHGSFSTDPVDGNLSQPWLVPTLPSQMTKHSQHIFHFRLIKTVVARTRFQSLIVLFAVCSKRPAVHKQT